MLEDVFFWLFIVLSIDALLMAGLLWMVKSRRFRQYRIRTPETYRIPLRRKIINISLNALLSTVFLISVIWYAHPVLIVAESAPWTMVVGQVIVAILLYDFMYYFLHRGMHHPKVMKHVHGVHHYARFPTSIESIYLHPAENLAGLTLLMVSIALIGPVSVAAFVWIFFVHSTVNILVHANMQLPHPAFRLTNFLAMKHDFHHGKYLNKNYASITPFWDLMFGTYR